MSTTLTADSPPSSGHAQLGNAKRGFFRNNIEAFTVAIVMALVIKHFAFEAFQVPTESMEPAILGRSPGGDRIIVNKFAYTFREPERWDVVVFRYPLSRLVNYVKRLVGLPGETLKIAHGDIYAKKAGGTDFLIARKPESVQDAIFLANPVIEEEAIDTISRRTFWDWWQRPLSGAEIVEKDEVLKLDAGPAEQLIQTSSSKFPGGITPERHDRDAQGRKGRGDEQVREPVGDLRFLATLTPGEGAKALVLRILDGTQSNRPLRLEVAVEGSGAASRFLHGIEDVSDARLKGATIPRGKKSKVVFENADDRVRVLVDGDVVQVYDYAQALDATPGGITQVSFGLTGGKAVFHRLGLWRDIYTTLFENCPATYEIPEKHYLFFGDNSPNSLDARAFRVVGIRLREDGRILLGDMEAVADDFDAPRQSNNPYFELDAHGAFKDKEVHHYRDIQGNHWKLASGSYDVLNLKAFHADSDVRILGLHQTVLPHPTPEQLALDSSTKTRLEAVSSATLATLVHNTHAFKANSLLVHYVHRDEIMGRANLVFLPGGKDLLETVFHFIRARVIR